MTLRRAVGYFLILWPFAFIAILAAKLLTAMFLLFVIAVFGVGLICSKSFEAGIDLVEEDGRNRRLANSTQN